MEEKQVGTELMRRTQRWRERERNERKREGECKCERERERVGVPVSEVGRVWVNYPGLNVCLHSRWHDTAASSETA